MGILYYGGARTLQSPSTNTGKSTLFCREMVHITHFFRECLQTGGKNGNDDKYFAKEWKQNNGKIRKREPQSDSLREGIDLLGSGKSLDFYAIDGDGQTFRWHAVLISPNFCKPIQGAIINIKAYIECLSRIIACFYCGFYATSAAECTIIYGDKSISVPFPINQNSLSCCVKLAIFKKNIG